MKKILLVGMLVISGLSFGRDFQGKRVAGLEGTTPASTDGLAHDFKRKKNL